ncbi:MAG: NAD-dependent epimerase/dehydratase family protein [Rhodospirillales bacterium]
MGAGIGPVRRATVFGASGFIGRYVVRRLAQRGYVVRACMRDPVAGAFLKTMGAVGQIAPLRVNLTDSDEALASAVQGADAVVNLVGILAQSGSQSFQAL